MAAPPAGTRRIMGVGPFEQKSVVEPFVVRGSSQAACRLRTVSKSSVAVVTGTFSDCTMPFIGMKTAWFTRTASGPSKLESFRNNGPKGCKNTCQHHHTKQRPME